MFVRINSSHFYKDYVRIIDRLPYLSIFDTCHFQNPVSDNCYYEYDITKAKVQKFPPKLISKLRNDDFISTRNTWKNDRDSGCGFIYLTKEDKKECIETLGDNPFKEEYSKSSKALVCSCNGSSCGAPNNVPRNIPERLQVSILYIC